MSPPALWFLVSGFCSESEVGDAPRCHALLWLTGGRPAMRSSPPGCRDPERKRRGSQHGCLGASDADRRGRCLSCPSPERLSCQRRALCEYFKYLSPVNSVWIYSVGDRNQLYHNVGGAANARGDLEGTTRSWQGLIARYHTCRSVPRITRTRR